LLVDILKAEQFLFFEQRHRPMMAKLLENFAIRF